MKTKHIPRLMFGLYFGRITPTSAPPPIKPCSGEEISMITSMEITVLELGELQNSEE
jgi:hypothetical protein